MYFVVETCERECLGVTPVADRQEAKTVMDGLLEAHCKAIGRQADYDAYAGPRPPETWPPVMQPYDPQSGESCAWCNAGGYKWDAFLTAMPPDQTAKLLEMLLAEKEPEEEDADA